MGLFQSLHLVLLHADLFLHDGSLLHDLVVLELLVLFVDMLDVLVHAGQLVFIRFYVIRALGGLLLVQEDEVEHYQQQSGHPEHDDEGD